MPVDVQKILWWFSTIRSLTFLLFVCSLLESFFSFSNKRLGWEMGRQTYSNRTLCTSYSDFILIDHFHLNADANAEGNSSE